MKLNKNVIRDLTHYGYDANDIHETKAGQGFGSIILISCGRGTLHESGYPFIIALGVGKEDKKLYDMGEHDHIWFPSTDNALRTINIESLGQNIFNFWYYDGFVAKYGNANLSSLTIESDGTVS